MTIACRTVQIVDSYVKKGLGSGYSQGLGKGDIVGGIHCSDARNRLEIKTVRRSGEESWAIQVFGVRRLKDEFRWCLISLLYVVI